MEQPLLRGAAGDRAGSGHLAPRRACIATATSSSTACSTRCPSRWSASACGCAPPTPRWRSIRTIGWWPPIRAAASPGSAHRARSSAARGAGLLRPRPRLVRRSRPSESARPAAQLIERLLADRIVERLRAAQGVLRLAETLRRRASGGRLRPRALPRQPLLPHRQDDPGRRLRSAAAARSGTPARRRSTPAARASRATPAICSTHPSHH